MNHRTARLLALAVLVGLTLTLPHRHDTAEAQESKPAPVATAAPPLTELAVVQRVNAATDKSLQYLASKQRPDGGWHNNHAVNALALLAFLGRGHTPGRGPYKDVLEKGKRYLLATANADSGYVSFGTMYEHGLATLALAELYGMDADPELEAKLRKAVDLIVKVQSPGGGWNYAPSPGDGDLSVSVMQIVALRAANNALVPVPPETIQKAVGYVRARANPQGPGFGYNAAGPGTPQTSAAGTLSLQLLGEVNDPKVAVTLDNLAQLPVAWNNTGAAYFYYFHYYAIQAFYQAGGKYWNEWHPKVRELLLAKQNPDGSWDVPPGTAEAEATVGPNKIYWTAMATLVLDIYQHFLPAYQR